MIQLKLSKKIKYLEVEDSIRNSFEKPLIFYMENINDSSKFFITYVIVDYRNKQLIYLDTYIKENTELIDSLENKNFYTLHRTPHRSVSIHEGIDFFTFIQEEELFFYVNYKDDYVKVYTFEDLLPDSSYHIKKIGSTFYKDCEDSNYMYMAAVDDNNHMHFYHVSLDLTKINEFSEIGGRTIPPHTLRRYKNYLFVSHDFGNAQFRKKGQEKIIESTKLATMFEVQKVKFRISKEDTSTSHIYHSVIGEHKLECVPGQVLVLDLKKKKEYYIQTNGTSPAHFEIDEKENMIYISSHNFFVWRGDNVYVEPAVIDKYQISDSGLEYVNTFKNEMGYRFTSHKFFYYNNQPYICTFGHPNRLLIIDANTMQLAAFYDIEHDELSSALSILDYINDRKSKFEIVPVEVSKDGRYIFFISDENIYVFDFAQRKICQKMNYKENVCDVQLRTAHTDYLE